MPSNIRPSAPLESRLFISSPPDKGCEVCVVIPVRNESATIRRTLHRLTFQYDLTRRPLAHNRYEIILLANNCTDDSARIARLHASEHPTLRLHVVECEFPSTEAHVGAARRALMNEAYRRLILAGRPRGIIASTDGDTLVSYTWIAATIAEMSLGVDAIGGRIHLCHDSRQNLDKAAYSTYIQDERYRLLVARLAWLLNPIAHDPKPHHQHFGASLAVTAEAYHLAGGMPAIPYLEDVAFYERLQHFDCRIRHSRQVHVVTSARMVGRVPIGLSQQLSEWSERGRTGEQPQVTSVAQIERRARFQKQLRSLWFQKRGTSQCTEYEAGKFACDAGIQSRWLLDELRSPSSFGSLSSRIERHSPVHDIEGMVDMTTAICQLRERIAGLLDKRRVRQTHKDLSIGSLEEINPVLLGSPVHEMSQSAL